MEQANFFKNNIASMARHGLISYISQEINKISVNQFYELLEVIQKSSLVKLYGGIEVWTLEKGIVTI
jgi:hypothetical protein